MNKMPFFIIGSQRSGTTLLRLILNAHSKIAIPEEGTFWMPLLRRYKKKPYKNISKKELKNILSYIVKNHQFKLWCIDPAPLIENILKSEQSSLRDLMKLFYEYYANVQNKEIWGDKTPSFFRMIPVLHKLFPEARFIHIVRDGRDLYLSWKKLNPLMKFVSLSAIEWKYKVNKIRDDLSRIPSEKWIEIKYENLVKNPKNIVKGICDFLEINYEEKMLEFWKQSHKYIGKHHSELIFKPISSKSVGKYKKELSYKDLRKYEILAQDLLKIYGYNIETRPNFFRDIFIYLDIFFEILYAFPLRIAQVFYIKFILDLSSKFGLATKAAGGGDSPNLK